MNTHNTQWEIVKNTFHTISNTNHIQTIYNIQYEPYTDTHTYNTHTYIHIYTHTHTYTHSHTYIYKAQWEIIVIAIQHGLITVNYDLYFI
jgi:hypothetical protein